MAEADLRCHYCKATLRSDFNFCAHCGMPVDPARDRPLFVIEGLTNLFNAVFFESLLDTEINRASRYGHHPSVLVVEIDGLKDLEAGYGYEETNQLIRAVADVISSVLRDPDAAASTNRVAALGMQRFFVLLPETDEAGAFTTAERIRSLVDNSVLAVGDATAHVTVSVGVATTDEKDAQADNLLARATQALIDSHTRGKNRIEVAVAT